MNDGDQLRSLVLGWIRDNPANYRRLARRLELQARVDLVDHPTQTWPEFAAKTRIRSGTGYVPFVPYDYQIELIRAIDPTAINLSAPPGGSRFLAGMKTRQLGWTETFASYMSWRATWDRAFLGVVFSKNQDDTSNVALRVKEMLISYDSGKGLPLDTDSKLEISITGGGRILFRPGTANSARGLPSISFILFDEASFNPNYSELFASSIPGQEMLGDRARAVIISTPNTLSDRYWQQLSSNNDYDVTETCRKMREGELPPIHSWIDRAGWCKFFVHWRAHPIYGSNPDYLDIKRRELNITEAQLQREYNLNPSEASDSVFSQLAITLCEVGAFEVPPGLYDSSGVIYVAGLDTSSTGDDYLVLFVLKVYRSRSVQLVAQYRERQKTKHYHLAKISETISQYRVSKLVVESNGTGQVYAEDLQLTLPSLEVEAKATTVTSKQAYIDYLGLMMERGAFQFPRSPVCPLADELRNFRRSPGGKLEAAPGWHDDCVMAAALALSACRDIWGDDGFGYLNALG
jgi:hypothetical protein